MHKGKFVLAQLTSLVPRYEFDKCVDRYNGNYRIKDFSCWSQFICMVFGQLTHRESITDIITCLSAHQHSLYHIGIQQLVAVSTLTRANENRDWRIYSDYASYLLSITRPLYAKDEEFSLDIANAVYALDSTTIDLCLSVFKWAKFRKHKGAIKMHTLLNLRGQLPEFIYISDGKMHDVNILDILPVQPWSFYVMDKAYTDFKRLCKIHSAEAFFVTRAKKNLRFKRICSRKINKCEGLRCDQTIRLVTKKSLEGFPENLRRIKFYDEEQKKTYVFLTNNFEISALTVANLYKQRWDIELFFKWIKQHLRIIKFWGTSPNAVKTQIWIAVCVYLLIAYAKKILKINYSLYEISQILSISVFNKEPINELLTNFSKNVEINESYKQLNIFDL